MGQENSLREGVWPTIKGTEWIRSGRCLGLPCISGEGSGCRLLPNALMLKQKSELRL